MLNNGKEGNPLIFLCCFARLLFCSLWFSSLSFSYLFISPLSSGLTFPFFSSVYSTLSFLSILLIFVFSFRFPLRFFFSNLLLTSSCFFSFFQFKHSWSSANRKDFSLFRKSFSHWIQTRNSECTHFLENFLKRRKFDETFYRFVVVSVLQWLFLLPSAKTTVIPMSLLRRWKWNL